MVELKLKILSSRVENNNEKESICYICEGTLDNYIRSIPNKYRDYDIQRGIVKNNVYLERLILTILGKKYIPSIVLVTTDSLNIKDGFITAKKYKILDGLQRSYRMKAIYNAYQLYLEQVKSTSKKEVEAKTKFKLSQELKGLLSEQETSIIYLWGIIEFYRDKSIDENIFKNFTQWFEIWDGLDKNEQINKMLILNAGHKSMDIKHQLELLFINIISDEYLKEFIRSKEISATYFYKNKKAGDLHLTHIISALIAFDKCKPILLNQKLLQELHENIEFELEQVKVFFMDDKLEIFINFLSNLDNLINEEYKEIGLQWIGRESILIGMFASFGIYFKLKYNKKMENLDDCFNEVTKILTNNIKKLKIDEFNNAKESVNIAKINIGDLFKYSVYYYFCQILESGKNKEKDNWQILKNSKEMDNWQIIFRMSKSEIKGEIKNECN